MTVLFHEDRLKFVRLELDPDEIPKLLKKHRSHWEPPERLESMGSALISGGFIPADAKNFAVEVIKWGRGHRFAGRFADENPADQVADALQKAVDLTVKQNTAEAVETVRNLKHLGQSFASKIVRFLGPSDAVILDKVLRDALGYPDTASGYRDFWEDCRQVLNAIAKRQPKLRICDVEAAVFAKIRGY